MNRKTHFLLRPLTTVLVGVAVLATTAGAAGQPRTKSYRAPIRSAALTSELPVGTQKPTREVVLSIGKGQLFNLPAAVSDVWTSNPAVADVYISSARQLQVFGVSAGEATVYAKNKAGQVLFSADVRVGANLNSLDRMLGMAMPDATITATTMNGLVLLTGTVASPDDAAEAERLVKALVGTTTEVVTRLRTATPLQVNLQVKIAEVSRSLTKQIGVNLLTRDSTSGFAFGITQGRSPGTITPLPSGGVSGTFTGVGAGTTTLGFLGRLFGVDVLSALDLAETNGLVTILAEPNLTSVSGETASFLAGGEFPIPISQALGTVTIEYKQFGVSLSFTPTVLADGRISMRVRPEVSQLSTDGAVSLNGFTVPALTTRRTETTVELGSGQSLMIGGLLQNNNANSISKAPGLGDVPVLGALFRSNGYRRNQTELMIVVTPYLVKPVTANAIALPTDGLRNPTDLQNFLLGQDFSGRSGAQRPKPTMAPPVTVPAPSVGSGPVTSSRRGAAMPAAAPGFSNN